MREILFRGKSIGGNWYYGVPLVFTDDFVCITAPHTYNKAVIPETVGQYTGLTDKNGKRIFEGDIIDTPDRLIKVVWFERNAQFDLNFIKHAHDKKIINFKGIEMRDLKEYEVIGNIHDNPELIESEDNK